MIVPRSVDERMVRTSQMLRPIAKIASTTVAFVNELNAPPEFRATRNSIVSPTMETGESE